MKNRGFTLIELLAVIVVLVIIALIIYPKINGIIADQQQRIYDEQVDRVIKLADTYINDKQDELTIGDDLNISIDNLYNNHYIKSKKLRDPKTNEDISCSYVKAIWNDSRNNYDYEFVKTKC